MRTILVALTAVMAFAGCAHSQMPPTTHSVALTWTAPSASGSWAGCTTAAPCTYVVSRFTGNTCPAVNIATPNYTPLNSSSPVSATNFTDTGAAGLTTCYIAQTIQGSAVSLPSNIVGPFVVGATPGAPTAPNGVVADMKQPVLPLPGETPAPTLSAKLVTR